MSGGSEREKRSGICRLTGERLDVVERRGEMVWWPMGVTAVRARSECVYFHTAVLMRTGFSFKPFLKCFYSGSCALFIYFYEGGLKVELRFRGRVRARIWFRLSQGSLTLMIKILTAF